MTLETVVDKVSARLRILTVAIPSLMPGIFLVYASPDCSGPIPYLTFPFLYHFIGTCPFRIQDPDGFGLGDVYYWPVLMALAIIALGIYGFITNSKQSANLFGCILIVSWILTLARFYWRQR